MRLRNWDSPNTHFVILHWETDKTVRLFFQVVLFLLKAARAELFFSHLQNEIRKNFRKKHKRLYPINYAANEVFALRTVWVSCGRKRVLCDVFCSSAGGPLASSEVRCDVSRRNKTGGGDDEKKWYLKGGRSDKLLASLCPVFLLQTSQTAWWSWKIKKQKKTKHTFSCHSQRDFLAPALVLS